MSLSTEALGGYLELELPTRSSCWLDTARKFNSARAAFASLVDQLNVKSVWLPRYLCNTMVDVLSDQNIALYFYDLTDDFGVKGDVALNRDSLLLYVNYFGVCTRQVLETIDQYGAENVVIDNSHALFGGQFEALATTYSPRKFFGLPDGGLLYSTDPRIKQPEQRDESSESRMAHLISRITNSPESAYQQYLEAEQAISKLPVQGMSHLTERLLQSVDYQKARKTRTKNAQYLHERLGQYNQLNLNIDETVAPLCYPFLPSVKAASKADLIKERVFVPTYWPEVLCRVEEGSFEWNLVTNGLFLPCDQRYNEEDMDRLISLLAIK